MDDFGAGGHGGGVVVDGGDAEGSRAEIAPSVEHSAESVPLGSGGRITSPVRVWLLPLKATFPGESPTAQEFFFGFRQRWVGGCGPGHMPG